MKLPIENIGQFYLVDNNMIKGSIFAAPLLKSHNQMSIFRYPLHIFNFAREPGKDHTTFWKIVFWKKYLLYFYQYNMIHHSRSQVVFVFQCSVFINMEVLDLLLGDVRPALDEGLEAVTLPALLLLLLVLLLKSIQQNDLSQPRRGQLW